MDHNMSDEELARVKLYAAENIRCGYGALPFLNSADTLDLIGRLDRVLGALLDLGAANYER